MKNTSLKNTPSIQIPLEFPESFQFLLFTSLEARDLKPLFKLLEGGEVEISCIENAEKFRLKSALQNNEFNLTAAETTLLKRAASVIIISIENRKGSYGESISTGEMVQNFKTLWEKTCELKQLLMINRDSINALFDLAQGRVIIESKSLDGTSTPPSGTFLTVKAYRQNLLSSSRETTLISEGLNRFGLPELALEAVPENLGADGAYLLRTVGQYILAHLAQFSESREAESSSPDRWLLLPGDISIESRFCEIENPDFEEENKSLIPLSLKLHETLDNVCLVKMPGQNNCDEEERYEDSLDWIIASVERIVEIRRSVHLRELDKRAVPTGLGLGK